VRLGGEGVRQERLFGPNKGQDARQIPRKETSIGLSVTQSI